MSGWVGVDLDGTLAMYIPGMAERIQVGPPVWPMVVRVKHWLQHGITVKVFTARVTGPDAAAQIVAIHRWLADIGIEPLECTATKDFQMIELWDDRCVQMATNTGMAIDPAMANPKRLPGR